MTNHEGGQVKFDVRSRSLSGYKIHLKREGVERPRARSLTLRKQNKFWGYVKKEKAMYGLVVEKDDAILSISKEKYMEAFK